MEKTQKNISIDAAIKTLVAESKYAKYSKASKIRQRINKIKGITEEIEVENTKYFNFVKNLIFKKGRIEHLIQLGNVNIPTLKFSEIEEVVLKSNNPEWCYKFVKAFPDVKREKYEKIILNSRHSFSCSRYAIFCNPWNIEPFQDVVCSNTSELENRKEILYFFKHVENADKKMVGQAFIDTYFDKNMNHDYAYPKAHTVASVKKDVDSLFNANCILGGAKIFPVEEERSALLKEILYTYVDDLARRVELNEMMDRNTIVDIK